MATREASKLCPIFREDDERIIDLPVSGSNALAGTVAVAIPYIAAQFSTAAATDVTVTGMAATDSVLVTPNQSCPDYARFDSVKTATNALTFEFFNATGSSIDGESAGVPASLVFLWRRINLE